MVYNFVYGSSKKPSSQRGVRLGPQYNQINNQILGNFIGVNATGTAPIGNALNGIVVQLPADVTLSPVRQ